MAIRGPVAEPYLAGGCLGDAAHDPLNAFDPHLQFHAEICVGKRLALAAALA